MIAMEGAARNNVPAAVRINKTPQISHLVPVLISHLTNMAHQFELNNIN